MNLLDPSYVSRAQEVVHDKSNLFINIFSVNLSKGHFPVYFLPEKFLKISGAFWEIILWK